MLTDFIEGNELYKKMIEEVEDYAIILLDENGFIQNWNAGAEKIKGYTSSEIIGKRFDIFYTEEDRGNNLPGTLLKQAKEKGRAIHEGWRIRKNGSKFWGTIVITALHDENNQLIGFSKVTRDLTDKKLADEKLLAYTTELERRNNELEQFAYVASHDLQEPLRKIETFAGMAQKNYANQELVNTYFEKLNNSAKRMSLLVKSLLNYSRLSKDTQEKTEVDLNIVLKETLQDFELMIEEKKAVIKAAELPAIKGNQVQLGQLFSNLISNALKFSNNNLIIEIDSSIVDVDAIEKPLITIIGKHYHAITFKDNGIGFDQQYEQVIFSMFQRLHGKHDYAGTGIGLALCKKIAENHNGFIKAKGKEGRGAVFTVYLPVN